MSQRLDGLKRFCRTWVSPASHLRLIQDSPNLEAFKQILTARRGLLWDREGEFRYVGAAKIGDAVRDYVNRVALAVAGVADECPDDIEIAWASLEPLTDVDFRFDVSVCGRGERADR